MDFDSLRTYDETQRVLDIYQRVKVAMGRVSRYTIVNTTTQESAINYGPQQSTKILEFK